MTRTFHGKVHGKTIVLDEDPGLPDGQSVEVRIMIKEASPERPWGEGIRRSAGIMADNPQGDEIMDEIQRDREGGKP